ncbi:MAG: EAL domain-containing protein [Candidatus Thiodiazotropha sp.]|nr:EAL domain-containing protein [Candidatus Thiodiazotropha sp.]MCM8884898.1 EAL domain-containing protein [Candidatus Thiodiazotropha sp.]MCM8921048.1 EAL domain-containing protein [Candidatus Thiodiazotropha sp.]
MTLSRQLVILITALLVLVFTGTFFISVQNTRSYLDSQMASHAQDTATSLGLSISKHLADGDLATVTAMTDAIFDRGYYRLVRVQDMQGEPLVDRELQIRLEGVPTWFIKRFPLSTPVGEATVMAGWVQAGRVIVQSHPGFAHRQLWENTVEIFWWFLASALIVLLLGLVSLRWVLKPLKEVELQANAIVNREFPIIEKLPGTLDLRRIVLAMNRMSSKVKQMIEKLEQLAERLQRQASRNPVTDLTNKRFFHNTVNTLLDTPEECSTGVLALIQLKSLKAINESQGYQAGDELLKQTAGVLDRVSHSLPKSHLAHLNGADFALFVEDRSLGEALKLGETLSTVLAGLHETTDIDDQDVGHIGLACFNGGQNLSELLSQADMSLRTAQGEGVNAWHLYMPGEIDTSRIKGGSDWQAAIQSALESDRIVLQFQPVYACVDESILHHEVFVRIREEDEQGEVQLLSAGLFIPHADRLGLTPEIDQTVISKVLERLKSEADQETSYAINISPICLKQTVFLNWLEQQLDAYKRVAHRLIFEMPEYGAVSLLEQVEQFIKLINRYGASFSLDHFGRSQSAFGYLKTIKVDYLKIDGSYLSELQDSTENQFFIQVLVDIAHGLEIKVIGEAVETAQTWKTLQKLNLAGGHGYYLGKPE